MTNQGEQGPQGIPGAPGATGPAVVVGNVPDPVIAYRLGQVEIAVREGFKAHDQKLTELVGNFATQPQLEAIAVRVKSLELSKAKNWIFMTASAAAGAALAILIGALIVGK